MNRTEKSRLIVFAIYTVYNLTKIVLAIQNGKKERADSAAEGEAEVERIREAKTIVLDRIGENHYGTIGEAMTDFEFQRIIRD